MGKGGGGAQRLVFFVLPFRAGIGE